MSALKRNIILSNKNQKTNEMAILTIEKLNTGIWGTLKIFNIFSKNLLLAISCNNQESFKDTVRLQNNAYSFKLSSNFDINGQIACVVVENENNKITPLVWDSVMANHNVEKKVETYFETKTQNHLNTKAMQSKPQNKDLSEMFDIKQNEYISDSQMERLFEQDSDEELTNLIDETIKNSEQPKQNLVFDDETENLKKQIDENSVFYDLVSEQIEDIFSKYPSEENLQRLIPNSKWVLVDYENDGNPYVLGLIYEETALKYICYGVPGEFSQNPPKDIEQYSQWLPKNPDNVSEGGYWVMYQDSVTGDNLLIEYI